MVVLGDEVAPGECLDEWVEKAIKPPMRTPRAYATYEQVIEKHLQSDARHDPFANTQLVES